MIRSFKPEDAVWIAESHVNIYNQEYDFDKSFRTFIEQSVSGFIERQDERENIWVVELEGKNYGSASIKKAGRHEAQLGLFLVDPALRGKAYGQALLDTAMHFCREKDYHRIILWTNSRLNAARHLYAKNGFEHTETRTQTLSGQELVEEKWQKDL